MDTDLLFRGNGPTVDWHSIQHLLENAVPDVVIFLDCCFAASADRRSVDGTIEVLAACCQNSSTAGVSDWSFTNRLTEVLRDCRNKPLTVAMLHAELLNYRAAKGSKKLLKSPVHSIMSNKDKASIRLVSIAASCSPPSSLNESDLCHQTSDSLSSISGSDPPLTRVLVAVSLNDHVPDVSEWLEWLSTHMPSNVTGFELIRPEGVWESHSTLFMISMPVAIWDLFPYSTAYHCVGYVRSSNLLTKDSGFNPDGGTIAKTRNSATGTVSHTAFYPMDGKNPPLIERDDILIVVTGGCSSTQRRFIDLACGSPFSVYRPDSGSPPWGCHSFTYQNRRFHLIDTPTGQEEKFEFWFKKRILSMKSLNGIISVHNDEVQFPPMYLVRWLFRKNGMHAKVLVLARSEIEHILHLEPLRTKQQVSSWWGGMFGIKPQSFVFHENRECTLEVLDAFLEPKIPWTHWNDNEYDPRTDFRSPIQPFSPSHSLRPSPLIFPERKHEFPFFNIEKPMGSSSLE